MKKLSVFLTGIAMATMLFSAVNADAASKGVAINTKNFPNSSIRQEMDDVYDSNGDGRLSKTEAKKVKKLNLSTDFQTNEKEKDVSLKGVQYFTELKELTINAFKEDSNITDADLSQNKKLNKLSIICNKLEGFRINTNNLKSVYFFIDTIEGGKLTIRNAKKLRKVQICAKRVEKMDFSGSSIRKLYLERSTKLKTVKLKGCSKLQMMEAYDTSISKLDISSASQLQELKITSSKLKKLDVSHNKKLKCLVVSSNKLSNLDVSANKQLVLLNCMNNRIRKMNVSHNKKLKTLDVSSNQLKRLNVCKNKQLEKLYIDDNKFSKINLTNNKKLTSFGYSDNRFKKALVPNASKLKYLYCGGNPFTKLDLSKCSKLKGLWIENSKMPTIDVSKCKALIRLDVSGAALTTLNLQANKRLKRLCANNTKNLLRIDVSGNTKLYELYCYDSNVKEIDMRNCLDVKDHDEEGGGLWITGCNSLKKIYVNKQWKELNYFQKEAEKKDLNVEWIVVK